MFNAGKSFSVLAVVLLLAVRASAAEPNAPEPPRAFVEIPQLTTTGRTIRVPSGGDLQKALDEAKGGDRIELEPRATYVGPFRLKAKDGDDWIVITSAGALPKPGRHVQPSEAATMAKLISAGDFVVATDGQFAVIDLNPVIVGPAGRGVRIADALIETRASQGEPA